MSAGREEFLAQVSAELPAVIAQFTQFNCYELGLLHCEVGAFRRATGQAMDVGRLWAA
jgi:hypothetical protein